jgi:hypothetical protein
LREGKRERGKNIVKRRERQKRMRKEEKSESDRQNDREMII